MILGRIRALVTSTCLAVATNAWAQSASEPDEVVIQSSPLDRRSFRDETAHSRVLRSDDLGRPGASTASVLTQVPGAQVQGTGANSDLATVSLRGGSSAQLPIYLGPFQLNDELTGSTDLSTVPLFFVHRLEIYRGHAPDFVDRLGLGGAIVIEPLLPKEPRLFAATTLGSYGATSASVRASAGNDRVGAVVGVQRLTAANDYPYKDNRGTVTDPSDDRPGIRQNADAESVEIWNSGYVRPSRSSRLRWLIHGFDREQGVTGLSIIPARHARAQIRRELGAVSAILPCRANGSPEMCHIELQSQLQRTRLTLEDPKFELGYGTDRVDATASRGSERIRLEHRPLPELRLGWLLGGDLGSLYQVNHAAEGLNASRRSALFGVHLSVYVVPRLTIVALGRATAESTAALQASPRTDILPSGRLGARYRIFDGLYMAGNIGRYLRNPTLAELYGVSASLRGNASLQSEHGVSEDFGLSSQFGPPSLRGTVEAIAYHQHLDDLVAWQRSSFGQIRPYNVGQARLMGMELSSAIAVSNRLKFEVTVAILDPRDVTPRRNYSNDILPYRSRLTTSLRIDAWLPHPDQIPGIRKAGLGTSLHHRSSRYAVPAGNAVLPSTTSVDIDAQIAIRHAPLSVRGSITNVFDRQNYDLVGMPLPGRCYFLALEADWELPQ